MPIVLFAADRGGSKRKSMLVEGYINYNAKKHVEHSLYSFDLSRMDIFEEKISEIQKCANCIIDFSATRDELDHYPYFARTVTYSMEKIANLNHSKSTDNVNVMGILVCRTGNGMNIMANRRSFIRSALCYNTQSAYYARNHLNANIATIGSDYTSLEESMNIVETFVNTDFNREEDRHALRILNLE